MAPGVITIVVLGAILTAGFVSLAKVVTNNQTRRRLAEKGMSAEEIRTLFQEPPPVDYGTLRAALLLLFVGGALMLAQYLPFDSRDPFVYGLVALAGGLGLLVYQLVLPAFRRRNGDANGRGRNA
jgi:hypothetical protein